MLFVWVTILNIFVFLFVYPQFVFCGECGVLLFARMCCVKIQSKLKLLWASPLLCALCEAGFGVNAPLLICSVLDVSP